MKIEKLQIFSNHLQEQFRFYHDILGLEIKEYSENRFKVQMGFSILEFQYKKGAFPYHIAFHIPDHQEQQALKWVKERVPVLKDHKDEIVDFSAWDAKSLYFYDADKNILEFISRGNFQKPSSSEFSEKSILGIAEIGVVTEDVQEKYKYFSAEYGLEKYDGDFERFCAIGDDQGLFITINGKQKDWFPTNDKAHSSGFCISFSHKEKSHSLIFEKDRLKPV